MTKSVARHFDSVARNVHHHNMAKTVSVVVTDDLDGTPDAETVAFSVEGQSYEIDLSQKNLAKLQKSLQPFMAAGRRTALRKAARPGRSAVQD